MRATSECFGVKAIVAYAMNALANSQAQELEKFLVDDYPQGKSPVTFRRYTSRARHRRDGATRDARARLRRRRRCP